MLRRLLGMALCVGSIGFAFTATAAQPAPPNVLVVVSDTLRRDHLGCYGYERDTSPNIDAFAQGATLFEHAYAQAPSTKPSMASLFVSRFPSQHQVIYNKQVLDASYTTLAEVLRAGGHATAGFVENSVVSKDFGFDQGFDSWVADSRRHGTRNRKRWGVDERRLEAKRADNFDGEVFEWLAGHRKQPFFLYVHYIDPHSPYQAPDEYLGHYSEQRTPAGADLKEGSQRKKGVATFIDKYDEEIRYVDDRFGRLMARLDELDLADRTVVVFLADHGEGFMEHGFVHHSFGVFSEVIDIPLIIRAPGQLPPGRVRGPVQQVDLFPTILELVGIESSPHAPEGRSLVSRARSESTDGDEAPVFSEHLRRGRGFVQQSIIIGDWKLVLDSNSGAFYLFDLAKDPRETRNVAGGEPERLGMMKRRLREQLSRVEPGVDPSEVELSPEVEESLKALGYM